LKTEQKAALRLEEVDRSNITREVFMALFGDVSKEAIPAKKIAANLSRLLPDFGLEATEVGGGQFVDRQKNHMRRSVEAADIITIAMAYNQGRISSGDLPFLLSNPVIAKASTLFLSSRIPAGREPIDSAGHLEQHFAALILELTHFYGRGPVDLESGLKKDYIEWREVTALIVAGETNNLLSEDDIPHALSDGEILPYLIKALQLTRILKGALT